MGQRDKYAKRLRFLKQSVSASRIGIILVGLLFAPAFSMHQDNSIHTERIPIQIGDTTIFLLDRQATAPGLTYLVLHDNEDTASSAALDVIQRQGGRLLELHNGGLRNVTFTMKGRNYTFDPNRIFTDAGARATLTEFSTDTPEAHRAVRALADSILQHLKPEHGAVLVTVHNNTKGEYSALSYTDGAIYGRDAKSVQVNRHDEIDNFFFVTVPAWFNKIREAGFNVVLQDNDHVTDDGSLSVWAGLHDISYVNVEAEHGRLAEQVHMLDFLNDLLEGEAVK